MYFHMGGGPLVMGTSGRGDERIINFQLSSDAVSFASADGIWETTRFPTGGHVRSTRGASKQKQNTQVCFTSARLYVLTRPG